MPVPGVYGTTMRTSLPGHACWAKTRVGPRADSVPAESAASRLRRRSGSIDGKCVLPFSATLPTAS